MAATFDDLKQALAQNLESRGIMGSIKARLRAEIFKSLHEDVEMPSHAPETDIVNELVMEYLEFHGFKHTASVFLAEASIQKPATPRTRVEIGSDLHIDHRDFPPDVPLLYGLCFKNLPPEPRSDRVIAPTQVYNAGFEDDLKGRESAKKESRRNVDAGLMNDAPVEVGYVEVTNAKSVSKSVGTGF